MFPIESYPDEIDIMASLPSNVLVSVFFPSLKCLFVRLECQYISFESV